MYPWAALAVMNTSILFWESYAHLLPGLINCLTTLSMDPCFESFAPALKAMSTKIVHLPLAQVLFFFCFFSYIYIALIDSFVPSVLTQAHISTNQAPSKMCHSFTLLPIAHRTIDTWAHVLPCTLPVTACHCITPSMKSWRLQISTICIETIPGCKRQLLYHHGKDRN